jgi:hypothetical protein
MALVALASSRSPGLTTAALALAMTWPAPRRAVVAELDPDGGTIAARTVIPHDPGLISVAAGRSDGVAEEDIFNGIQQLANGTLVLLAPPGPDRVRAALEALIGTGVTRTLGRLPVLDVLADCGRLDRWSPALPYVAAADAVVFVVRSSIEDVIGLQHRLQTLEVASSGAGVIVVGDRPYGPDEVARALGVPVVGVIEDDPRAARTIGEAGVPAQPLCCAARLRWPIGSSAACRPRRRRPRRERPQQHQARRLRRDRRTDLRTARLPPQCPPGCRGTGPGHDRPRSPAGVRRR